MRLGIEIFSGRFFYIEVRDEETIEGLKKEITSKEMFEENRLLLIQQNGCLMNNNQCKLTEYGCTEGCILYLYFMPGGSSPWPMFYEDCASFMM